MLDWDNAAARAAIRLARERTPAQIGAVVCCLRDNGMGELASVLIGELPFTAEQDWRRPSRAELERLTDE